MNLTKKEKEIKDKAYNEGYESGKNSKGNEFSPVSQIITILVIGFFAIFLVVVFRDNVDIDDTLAPYMCESHGLEFVSVDYRYVSKSDFWMKVSCRNVTEEAIDDGYLVLLK